MTSTAENLGRAANGTLDRIKHAAGMNRPRAEAPVDSLILVEAPATPAEPVAIRTPAPTPASEVTVISTNVNLSGTLVTPDELHVSGKITGNVRATSVTIRATGMIKGDIVAESIFVLGHVEGRMFAKKVQLGAGGVVRGDIVHGQLGIDTDAIFEGSSKRAQDALADAPSFSGEGPTIA